MQKTILLIALSYLIDTNLTFAQDVIKTNNGNEIKAKVVDMTYFTVIYKITGGNDSSLVTLPKSSISKITFANGKEEIFNSAPTNTAKDTTVKVATPNTTEDLYTRESGTNSTQQPLINTTPNTMPDINNDDDLLNKGKRDAEIFYTNYKGGAIGTGATACVMPCLGLIPAIAITHSTIKEQNLGFPDQKLMKNQAYSRGYRDVAERKKAQQTWKGFAVGSLLFVGGIFITYVISFGLLAALGI